MDPFLSLPGPSNHHLPSQPTSNPSSSSLSSPISTGGAGGPLVKPHQELDEFLESFWTRQMEVVEREDMDGKSATLPLARIKKVMKSDEEVKVGPCLSCLMVDADGGV